jgi:hypothetical protein
MPLSTIDPDHLAMFVPYVEVDNVVCPCCSLSEFDLFEPPSTYWRPWRFKCAKTGVIFTALPWTWKIFKPPNQQAGWAERFGRQVLYREFKL